MKRLCCLMIIAICLCLALPAAADDDPMHVVNITLSGSPIDGGSCYNEDGALCLQMLPVAKALGYKVETSELKESDAYRVVYTLTPKPAEDGSVGSELMVAYSIEDGQPLAVAVSKDQIMLPLKQSMTLADDEPYLPTEFFETGMCVMFSMDSETQTLDIQLYYPN